MPRRPLIRQDQFPYHVTTRTNNKDWFKIPIEEVWKLCKQSLYYAISKRPIQLNCFVLMGNHYHMLLTTPNSDIDVFIMHFNRCLSNLINKETGVINHKFSNRYKWTIVGNQSYLLNVYRYIYQNPVRAKITSSCFAWPYSSIHFTKSEKELFNLVSHICYREEKWWLEQKIGSDFDLLIKNSLMKSEFQASGASVYFKKVLDNPKKLTY